MKVVYYDREQGEHITIDNVWKIERAEGHIYKADGIRVYYLDNCERKGLRIPYDFVTEITLN